MIKKTIHTGISVNDGTGDSLKVASEKINHNFDLLYDALGDFQNISLTIDIGNMNNGSILVYNNDKFSFDKPIISLSSYNDELTYHITPSVGNRAIIQSASNTTAGLMTAYNYNKLLGIEYGAQRNELFELFLSYNNDNIIIDSSLGTGDKIVPANSRHSGTITTELTEKLQQLNHNAQKNEPVLLHVTTTRDVVVLSSSTGNSIELPNVSNDTVGLMTADDFDVLGNAANKTHYHSVTDITSGVFDPSFGGTGFDSYELGDILVGIGNSLTRSKLYGSPDIRVYLEDDNIYIQNTSPGYEQNIFKNISNESDVVQITASKNDDVLRFAGGDIANINFDKENNSIIFEAEPTNLSCIRSSDTLKITSSTGRNTEVCGASHYYAGVFTSLDKRKLDSIEHYAETNLNACYRTNLSFFGIGEAIYLGSSTGNSVLVPVVSDVCAGFMTPFYKDIIDRVIDKGCGITHLSFTGGSNTVCLVSSTGTAGHEALVPIASTSNAGFMSVEQKAKLDVLSRYDDPIVEFCSTFPIACSIVRCSSGKSITACLGGNGPQTDRTYLTGNGQWIDFEERVKSIYARPITDIRSLGPILSHITACERGKSANISLDMHYLLEMVKCRVVSMERILELLNQRVVPYERILELIDSMVPKYTEITELIDQMMPECPPPLTGMDVIDIVKSKLLECPRPYTLDEVIDLIESLIPEYPEIPCPEWPEPPPGEPPPPADIGIFTYLDVSGSMQSANGVTLDGNNARKCAIATQIIKDFNLTVFPTPSGSTMCGGVSGVNGAAVPQVADAIAQFIKTHCDKKHNNRLVYVIINDSQDKGTATWDAINAARDNHCPGVELHVYFLRIDGHDFNAGRKAELDAFINSRPAWVPTFFFDDYKEYVTGGAGSSIGAQISHILTT